MNNYERALWVIALTTALIVFTFITHGGG